MKVGIDGSNEMKMYKDPVSPSTIHSLSSAFLANHTPFSLTPSTSASRKIFLRWICRGYEACPMTLECFRGGGRGIKRNP